MANYQDFQLIDRKIQEYSESSNGSKFMKFILNKIYLLSESEIDECITDKNYVNQLYRGNNEFNIGDSGIDAIIIDDEKKEILIFNFKYKNNFDNVSNLFEGSEIPKIKEGLTFIQNKNPIIRTTTNVNFINKVEEIWSLMDRDIFTIKILFVTNGSSGFSDEHSININSFVAENRQLSYQFILLDDIVSLLVENTDLFNAKFRAIEKNYFDKSGPSVRTLVCEITAKDLIRISLESETIRNSPDASNVDIKNSPIEELIFDANVRGYLRQRGEINQSIKTTALSSEESPYFFYYNNGITILCNSYDYNSGRSPLVLLEGIQIVNGSQTIHSLKDAFDENSDNFDDITILARIYATHRDVLYRNIAKFTNSQNAVTGRDLKTNDRIHSIIKEFLITENINYIIKRGDSRSQEMLNIEIDLLGQILMSWELEMPGEAKNKKSIIFGDKYDSIFKESLSLEKLLKLIKIYIYVEEQKVTHRSENTFLAHASFYILFFIKKFQVRYPTEPIENLYNKAINFITDIVITQEKIRHGDDYSDPVLFKSNRPKDYISQI